MLFLFPTWLNEPLTHAYVISAGKNSREKSGEKIRENSREKSGEKIRDLSREKKSRKSREKKLKARKKSRQKKLSAKFEWHLLGSVEN